MWDYFVTLGVLTAALACYVWGAEMEAAVLAGLAIVLESMFWIRVARRDATEHFSQ